MALSSSIFYRNLSSKLQGSQIGRQATACKLAFFKKKMNDSHPDSDLGKEATDPLYRPHLENSLHVKVILLKFIHPNQPNFALQAYAKGPLSSIVAAFKKPAVVTHTK